MVSSLQPITMRHSLDPLHQNIQTKPMENIGVQIPNTFYVQYLGAIAHPTI